MSSQDDIVTDFTTLATVSAQTLISEILTYHQDLGTLLFSVITLDSGHKAQIRDVNKSTLIALRARLEDLVVTVRKATEAGSF